MRKCILLFFIWILAIFIASRVIKSTGEADEPYSVNVKVDHKASLVVDGIQDNNRQP